MLSSLYAFMRGLSLPCHKRRVSVNTRADVKWASDMLKANMGKGHFAYDRFERAPPVYTDASRSDAYTGGGMDQW